MVVWPGDVYQTGGAFVLGPGNLCDFAFRSAFAGDHVDLPGLLKFATGSTPDGQEVVYERERAPASVSERSERERAKRA
jgi:hypothetical protein